MSWRKDIEELRAREALAEEMGGQERVARQKSLGKLTVRERVDVEIRREDGFESDIEARMDKVESNAIAAEKRARGAETAARQCTSPLRSNPAECLIVSTPMGSLRRRHTP